MRPRVPFHTCSPGMSSRRPHHTAVWWSHIGAVTYEAKEKRKILLRNLHRRRKKNIFILFMKCLWSKKKINALLITTCATFAPALERLRHRSRVNVFKRSDLKWLYIVNLVLTEGTGGLELYQLLVTSAPGRHWKRSQTALNLSHWEFQVRRRNPPPQHSPLCLQYQDQKKKFRNAANEGHDDGEQENDQEVHWIYFCSFDVFFLKVFKSSSWL